MSEHEPRTPFYKAWGAKYKTWATEIAPRWFRLLEWLVVTSAFVVGWTRTHNPAFLAVSVVSFLLIIAWTAFHIVPTVTTVGIRFVVNLLGERRVFGPPPPPPPSGLDFNDKEGFQRYMDAAMQSAMQDPSAKRSGWYFLAATLATFGIVLLALTAVSWALYSALSVLASAGRGMT